MIRTGILILVLLLAACAEQTGPPVIVSNLVVTAAARDMPMAAAYLDISNHSGEPIRITRVTSPNYQNVEIHETTIENGIARMRKRDSVDIAEDETVRFERGGLHLMLMRPIDDADKVTLNFYQQDLLVVSISGKFTQPTE